METQSYRQTDLNGLEADAKELENIPQELQGEEEPKEEKSADNGACDGAKGEDINDAPEKESIPVFEQVGWKTKVQEFLQVYPIAKDFSSQIGEIIADSKELSQDENCLEKALATALAKAYVAPEKIASDEDFLQKYVFGNQEVKDRIIEEYLESLQRNLPPKSISSRGQITLTPPSRPTSIAEAGSVFKAMFNNRRI
ncbi:MAG: hypothetical protein K2L52_00950 [Clostridia bacterium]|nr:hypothetical protein [Clostridia bacterium]